METAGYNRAEVESLYGDISETYQKVVDGIAKKIQKKLINEMDDEWYAPEAVEYFDGVVEAVRKMGNEMQKAYQQFANWIHDTGAVWAENTKGEAPASPNIAAIPVEVNNTLQSQHKGDVILDEEAAMNTAAKMPELHADCVQHIKDCHGKLKAKSAFIGHGQAAAANECFVRVADAVSKLFDVLEAIGEDLKKFADKYKEIGTQLASKLGAANMSA